jgi:hypothetical protein
MPKLKNPVVVHLPSKRRRCQARRYITCGPRFRKRKHGRPAGKIDETEWRTLCAIARMVRDRWSCSSFYFGKEKCVWARYESVANHQHTFPDSQIRQRRSKLYRTLETKRGLQVSISHRMQALKCTNNKFLVRHLFSL